MLNNIRFKFNIKKVTMVEHMLIKVFKNKQIFKSIISCSTIDMMDYLCSFEGTPKRFFNKYTMLMPTTVFGISFCDRFSVCKFSFSAIYSLFNTFVLNFITFTNTLIHCLTLFFRDFTSISRIVFSSFGYTPTLARAKNLFLMTWNEVFFADFTDVIHMSIITQIGEK